MDIEFISTAVSMVEKKHGKFKSAAKLCKKVTDEFDRLLTVDMLINSMQVSIDEADRRIHYRAMNLD